MRDGLRRRWTPVRARGRQHLANLEAIGAFGLAEQLGLALAIEQLADAAWEVVHEKTRDQLLLQEYLLEMGPVAILYKMRA